MQKNVLWLGVAIFSIALLFPPWHGALIGAEDRFAFLFASEPLGRATYGGNDVVSASIDVPTWSVVLASIGALTFATYVALGLKNR